MRLSLCPSWPCTVALHACAPSPGPGKMGSVPISESGSRSFSCFASLRAWELISSRPTCPIPQLEQRRSYRQQTPHDPLSLYRFYRENQEFHENQAELSLSARQSTCMGTISVSTRPLPSYSTRLALSRAQVERRSLPGPISSEHSMWRSPSAATARRVPTRSTHEIRAPPQTLT